MDLPQLAQMVRSVGFPSARQALPLVGKRPPLIPSHQVELTRWAALRDGALQWDRLYPGQLDKSPSGRDRAADEEPAAIAGPSEPAADLAPQKPDALVPNYAEERGTC